MELLETNRYSVTNNNQISIRNKDLVTNEEYVTK